jgi:hypothetical protein
MAVSDVEIHLLSLDYLLSIKTVTGLFKYILLIAVSSVRW